MELTERFVVPAAADRVWRLFDDVPEIVACMPGAELTERLDDLTYSARLTIAVGPIRPKFDVRATIERDDAAREGCIRINAVDKGGGSRARGEITYTVAQEGDATAVELVQHVTLSGPLAQFGRTGVIEDINAQMTRQFAECLAAKLTTTASAGESGEEHAATTSDPANQPVSPAQPATSTEIRIVPLFARTLSARILRVLRLRK